jgi:hypothetical protein
MPAESEALSLVLECLKSSGINDDRAIGADMRHLSTSEIIALCQRLVSTDLFVLHGSALPVLFEVLHPRPADDASKVSGNLRAVYASTDVLQALLHATLNKPYLASVLRSFTIGYCRVGGSMQIRLSDNVYEMFKDGNPHVRTEGIVYVLLKAVMTHSWDALHEYHSEASVIPLASLKVPASVGESLLVFPSESAVGTLRRFSTQEQVAIAEHLRSCRNVR